MVVIFITEKRDGILTNLNCIKYTLMTVNRELGLSVLCTVIPRNVQFHEVGKGSWENEKLESLK